MKTKKRAVRRISCVTINHPGLLPHEVGYKIEEEPIRNTPHSSQTPEATPLDATQQTNSSRVVLSSLRQQSIVLSEGKGPAVNICRSACPTVNVAITTSADDQG